MTPVNTRDNITHLIVTVTLDNDFRCSYFSVQGDWWFTEKNALIVPSIHLITCRYTITSVYDSVNVSSRILPFTYLKLRYITLLSSICVYNCIVSAIFYIQRVGSDISNLYSATRYLIYSFLRLLTWALLDYNISLLSTIIGSRSRIVELSQWKTPGSRSVNVQII